MAKFCSQNKLQLLQKLESYSKITEESLAVISNDNFPHDKSLAIGNIEVSTYRKISGHKYLEVTSMGDPHLRIPMIKFIESTRVKTAWMPKGNKCTNIERLNKEICKEVVDVLSLIPPELLNDACKEESYIESNQNDEVEGIHLDNEETDDQLPDLNGANTQYTASNNTENQSSCNILQAIVDKLLKMKNADKCLKKNLNTTSLFKDYLCCATAINEAFTVPKLDMIGQVVSEYTKGKVYFKKSDRKPVKINAICQHFGDKSTLNPTLKKLKQVAPLTTLARKCIVHTYPKEVLIAAAAYTYHVEHSHEWEDKYYSHGIQNQRNWNLSYLLLLPRKEYTEE